MLASLFPWLMSLAALAGSLFLYFSEGQAFWQSLFFFTVIFNGSIQALWAAVGHLFFPEQTAKKIGWKSNGFQTEIGGTNLAIGIVAALCVWNKMWLTPVGLIIAIFYSSCIYIHIKDKVQNHNNAPCNSGPMLYNSILVVITLIVSILMK